MRVIRAEQLTRSTESNATLERHCVHTARCEMAGVVMELCTDIPEVAQLFALRYADHRTAREPDFRYFAATIRGGYAFWCGDRLAPYLAIRSRPPTYGRSASGTVTEPSAFW